MPPPMVVRRLPGPGCAAAGHAGRAADPAGDRRGDRRRVPPATASQRRGCLYAAGLMPREWPPIRVPRAFLGRRNYIDVMYLLPAYPLNTTELSRAGARGAVTWSFAVWGGGDLRRF